jgi:hypothetical protein
MAIITGPRPPKLELLVAFIAGVGVGIFITITFHYFAIGPRPATAIEAPAQR